VAEQADFIEAQRGTDRFQIFDHIFDGVLMHVLNTL